MYTNKSLGNCDIPISFTSHSVIKVVFTVPTSDFERISHIKQFFIILPPFFIVGSNVLKIFCPCPERQEQKYQRVYYKSSPKAGEHKKLTIDSGQSFVAMFVYYIPLFTGYQSLYKHGLKDTFMATSRAASSTLVIGCSSSVSWRKISIIFRSLIFW